MLRRRRSWTSWVPSTSHRPSATCCPRKSGVRLGVRRRWSSWFSGWRISQSAGSRSANRRASKRSPSARRDQRHVGRQARHQSSGIVTSPTWFGRAVDHGHRGAEALRQRFRCGASGRSPTQLDVCAGRYGSRPFVLSDDARLSYADVAAESRRLADGLARRCGIAQAIGSP